MFTPPLIAALLVLIAPAQVIDMRSVPVASDVQADELPSPETIIARHVEVTGGRARHEAVRNRKVVGTFRQNDQNVPSTITMYESPPRSRHVDVSGPGGGMQFITNGEESWTYSGDVVVMSSGDQRVQELRRATFNLYLDWPELYALAKTMSIEPVEGHPAYKVRLIAEDCHAVFLYFDVTTGRHVRTVQDIAYAGDTIQSDATLSAYRAIDGVSVPTKTRRILLYQGNRMVQEYEFTTVEYNVEFPAGLFDDPLAPDGG